MVTKLVIKIGDFVRTNGKYDGEKEAHLKVIDINTHCFINREQTYLLEDKDGKRAYYGKSWVEKESNNDLNN